MAERILRPVRLTNIPRERFTVTRDVPRTVRIAVWVLVALAAVAGIRILVDVLTLDWNAYLATAVHSFVHNGRTLHVTTAEAIGGRVASWALGLVVVGVKIVLSLLLRRGLNWVRVLLSVFAVLGLLAMFFQQNPFIYLEDLITAAAVGSTWLPESNAFFRQLTEDWRKHRARQFR